MIQYITFGWTHPPAFSDPVPPQSGPCSSSQRSPPPSPSGPNARMACASAGHGVRRDTDVWSPFIDNIYDGGAADRVGAAMPVAHGARRPLRHRRRSASRRLQSACLWRECGLRMRARHSLRPGSGGPDASRHGPDVSRPEPGRDHPRDLALRGGLRGPAAAFLAAGSAQLGPCAAWGGFHARIRANPLDSCRAPLTRLGASAQLREMTSLLSGLSFAVPLRRWT